MEAKEGFYTLNNGNKIPTVALGTWQSKEGDVEKAVVAALENGYRSIDTAPVYGNEVEIGKSLTEVFAAGTVKREDVFITTKVWCSNHRKEDVKKSCLKSMADLQVEYIDLLLIHWSWCGSANHATKSIDLEYVPISETWAAMEQLVEEGLVKNIGISNFNVQLILDMLSYVKIKPAVLQVELHPYHPQTELVNWCTAQGILLEAYCPLGLGSVPGSVAPDVVKIIENPVITEIAQRLEKSPAQVILAWGLARGTRILPKSANNTRINENLASASFTLSAEDVEKINNMKERTMFYDVWTRMGLPIFC